MPNYSSMQKISESSLNVCHKYHSYINQYVTNRGNASDYKPIKYDLDNPSNYSEFLNIWVDDLYRKRTIEDANIFIVEMLKAHKNDIEDFCWLDNFRVCYFAWIYLKKGVGYDKEKLTPNLPILDEICSSIASRNKVIKQYFQSWDTSSENRIEVINHIKNDWLIVDKQKHPFQKLMEDTNNQNLIEWTWSYIISRLNNDFERKAYRISQLFSPTTLNEKYQAIFAIHDYFYTNNKNLHKVFCSEYKKALSQKIFREKEDVKTINVQLNLQVKEKLNKLQYHYQYSQQRLLEMLINEHYNSIKNKIE